MDTLVSVPYFIMVGIDLASGGNVPAYDVAVMGSGTQYPRVKFAQRMLMNNTGL